MNPREKTKEGRQAWVKGPSEGARETDEKSGGANWLFTKGEIRKAKGENETACAQGKLGKSNIWRAGGGEGDCALGERGKKHLSTERAGIPRALQSENSENKGVGKDTGQLVASAAR